MYVCLSVWELQLKLQMEVESGLECGVCLSALWGLMGQLRLLNSEAVFYLFGKCSHWTLADP